MDLTEMLIGLVNNKGTEILFNKDALMDGLSYYFAQERSRAPIFEACVDNRFFAHANYKKNIDEILFLRHKIVSDFSDKKFYPKDTRYVLDSFLKLAEHLRGIKILSVYDEKSGSAYELLAAAIRSYDAGNYRPAIAAFNSLSSSNVGVSHYYLGKCYYEGKGVAKDYDKAAKCFAKGILADSSYAVYYLGSCYLKGLGVKKDIEKGTGLLVKAADMGQEDAVFAVGYMFKDSIAKIPSDIKKAIEYLQASADYGNWSAAITICDLYYEDAKTTGNFNKTSAARDRIGNVKDPETCFKIAQIYERGIGVPANLEKALNYSTKAAAKGYPGAAEMMTRIGNMKLGR